MLLLLRRQSVKSHFVFPLDSGHVYQWGTGLFRSQCPPPVPSHLSSKVPCLVPGKNCTLCSSYCPIPIVVCLEIYSDIDIHPHLSDLDQKTPRVVAAGSAHCVYLTGMTFIFVGMKRNIYTLQTCAPT